MLNEILEFEAYVTEPCSPNPRLKPKLLTEKFSFEDGAYKLKGIDQIMTIVLRGFLFPEHAKDFFDENGLLSAEGIAISKEVLNIWCGFSDSKKASSEVKKWLKKYRYADHWLKKYWIFQYEFFSEKKKPKKEGAAEWEILAEKWRKDFNDDTAYKAESYTFDNIIANALEKGPLKQRYCIVKKSADGKKIKKMKDLTIYLFDCNEKNRVEKTEVKMLKNIIAFQIGQEEHPGNQKEVILQRLRLFGWYDKDDEDGKLENWCFPKYLYREKKLSIMTSRRGTDYAKFGINIDYLKEYAFQLIDQEEIEKYREKYWIIDDRGKELDILNI